MPPAKKAPTAATQRRNAAALAATANKEYGPETVVLASEARLVRPRLQTGSVAFDAVLGGGLPANQWSEIVGWESHGKTAFAFKTIAHNQKYNPEFMTLWGAAEEFDPLRAQQAGVDLSRVILVEENVMEVAFSVILEHMEERVCDLVVIDSLAAMMPESEDDGDMGDHNVGRHAKVVNQFFRKAGKAGKRSLLEDDRPVAGICINQWRQKVGVMFGDNRTTPGGVGKNFHMHVRAEIKREDWIKDSDKERKDPVGIKISINPFKNKTFRPRVGNGVTDFYFAGSPPFVNGEYDDAKALLDWGVMYDVVEKASGGYRYENVFYRGRLAFHQATREQPDIAAAVYRQIIERVNPDEHEALQAVSAAKAPRRAVRRRG